MRHERDDRAHSSHTCETCGQEFIVSPPAAVFRDCLAPECPSYDPALDLDWVGEAIRPN